MRAPVLVSMVTLGLAAGACAKSSGDASVLPPADLAASGAQFDPNEIVDLGSFTDSEAFAASDVAAFFSHTPYGGASFLATYDSNGVAAADAVATAAAKYTLNPLVFLARAEMDQGLIAASTYPSDPARVEYVFGCGCDGAGTCDPDYAGFDVQVDCLGAALRDDLDDITANGQTPGGWAPMVATVTIDGVTVTPDDASTAALYQYTPVVAVGQPGGNWLFWNIWQSYASALGYAGPVATTPGGAQTRRTLVGRCGEFARLAQKSMPVGITSESCSISGISR